MDQMNSFFQKKKYRRWTWKSLNGRTRNEIDYFIADRKYILRDINVLNKFAITSDH